MKSCEMLNKSEIKLGCAEKNTPLTEICIFDYNKYIHGDIHVPVVKVIFVPLSKITHISLISNRFCPETTGQTD